MNNDTLYERTRLRDRFKDIITLSLFTLGVAVISLVAMNIMVYPVALLAVTQKEAFNFIITDCAAAGLALLVAAVLARKVIHLKREGLTGAQIAALMVRRPFRYLALFFFFVAVAAVVIALLYVLFGYNYYFLYRIMN